MVVRISNEILPGKDMEEKLYNCVGKDSGRYDEFVALFSSIAVEHGMMSGEEYARRAIIHGYDVHKRKAEIMIKSHLRASDSQKYQGCVSGSYGEYCCYILETYSQRIHEVSSWGEAVEKLAAVIDSMKSDELISEDYKQSI